MAAPARDRSWASFEALAPAAYRPGVTLSAFMRRIKNRLGLDVAIDLKCTFSQRAFYETCWEQVNAVMLLNFCAFEKNSANFFHQLD